MADLIIKPATEIIEPKELTWEECDVRSKHRGIHVKYNEQLAPLPDIYSDNMKKLRDLIKTETERYGDLQRVATIDLLPHIERLPEIIHMRNKITRITDKQLTVVKEIEGRNLGIFKRTELLGTDYYIDLNAGNDGNTGLSIAQAWKTVERYLVTAVKVPGDRGFVRANTTEVVAATFGADEQGDMDDYIYLIGCDSVTNDPWSDGSDVLPILNFNNLGNYMQLASDRFYRFERIDFRNNNVATTGLVYVLTGCNYIYFKDCVFRENNHASGACFRNRYGDNIILDGCTLRDGGLYALHNSGANTTLKSCTLDAGTISPASRAIDGSAGGIIDVVDCEIGQNQAFATADISAYTTLIRLRNTAYDKTKIPSIGALYNLEVFSEDDNQVAGAQWSRKSHHGVIEKDTTITRPTGASSSAKMTPESTDGITPGEINFLTLGHNSCFRYPFKAWLVKDIATTMTVYIRATAAWTVYPTADELFVEWSYLNHAVNPTRATVRSTEVLTDGSTWVAFTATFTPLMTGYAYGEVFLGLYEAGKSINVDLKADCSEDGQLVYEWFGGIPETHPPLPGDTPPVYYNQSLSGSVTAYTITGTAST